MSLPIFTQWTIKRSGNGLTVIGTDADNQPRKVSCIGVTEGIGTYRGRIMASARDGYVAILNSPAAR